MPKFLGHGSYAAEGWRGLKKETATHRRASVANFVESAGGKLEAFYFAFGEHDFVWIADFPDTETAAAVAVTVLQSGVIKSHQTLLLTAEDMDLALKKDLNYRPPGG